MLKTSCIKYVRRLENLVKPGTVRLFSSMIFCQQTSEPQPRNSVLLFGSLQHSSVNNSNKVHFCLYRRTTVVKSSVSETALFQNFSKELMKRLTNIIFSSTLVERRLDAKWRRFVQKHV